MKLYLSEYGKFKPRDGKGSEGVICTFVPFDVYDSEQKQEVKKGYFFCDHDETIERLDKHPDKGTGFIEWSASAKLPHMIHGRLIAANMNNLQFNKERLARISENTGEPIVVKEITATKVKETPEVKISPDSWIKYGEIKGMWLKKDGEFQKNTPPGIIEEFNKLKETLGV
jgi:hypothetical protein